MKHFRLKHIIDKLWVIITLIIFLVIIIENMKSSTPSNIGLRILMLMFILMIIKLIIIRRKKIYIKKLQLNTKPIELYFVDTWIICYGPKSKKTNFDYLLVFKDKNNKKYIANTSKLFGKYKCKIEKDGFKFYDKNKNQIETNQKFKVYIDEDYGYTIYDKETNKIIIGITPIIKEEKNMDIDLTKHRYIMMNKESELSEYDDAIYFKGVIEL